MTRLLKETRIGLKNGNEAIARYLLRQTELASQTQRDLATLQRLFAILFMLHYNKRVAGRKSEPHRERHAAKVASVIVAVAMKTAADSLLSSEICRIEMSLMLLPPRTMSSLLQPPQAKSS